MCNNHFGVYCKRTTTGFMVSTNRVRWVHVAPIVMFGQTNWQISEEDQEALPLCERSLLDAIYEAVFVCERGQHRLDFQPGTHDDPYLAGASDLDTLEGRS